VSARRGDLGTAPIVFQEVRQARWFDWYQGPQGGQVVPQVADVRLLPDDTQTSA
jgi:hypothetical protein